MAVVVRLMELLDLRDSPPASDDDDMVVELTDEPAVLGKMWGMILLLAVIFITRTAMGLMFHDVTARSEVELVLDVMRYPPRGHRGVTAGAAPTDYRTGDAATLHRLVERGAGVAEAPNAGAVTERAIECLAEHDGHVLDGVVLVHPQIARAVQLEVDQ